MYQVLIISLLLINRNAYQYESVCLTDLLCWTSIASATAMVTTLGQPSDIYIYIYNIDYIYVQPPFYTPCGFFKAWLKVNILIYIIQKKKLTVMYLNNPKQPTLYSVTAALRATVERTSAAVSLNIVSSFPW